MEILLNRIQYHNDQNAFRQFYEALYFRLYQFAYSFVHSRETSEELVNDVFLTLWQKRNTLNTIDNTNVYLYVSVKNACLNFLRRNHLALPVSLDELCVDHFQLVADPELRLVQKEQQNQMREAIEQLPPRCRLIFKLVKEDGLSYKEVASVLDISIKTVDAQLCLALKKLAVLLQPICPLSPGGRT